MGIGKKERDNRELQENEEVMKKYHSNPPPKGPAESPYKKKGGTDDKYYGSGKSMSDRFKNFVTGGASETLKKANK